MGYIKNTERTEHLVQKALAICNSFRHEFLMPEHFIMALLDDKSFVSVLKNYTDIDLFKGSLSHFLEETEKVPEDISINPQISDRLQDVLNIACMVVASSQEEYLDITHLIKGLLDVENSWGASLLQNAASKYLPGDFLCDILYAYADDEEKKRIDNMAESMDVFSSTQHGPEEGNSGEPGRKEGKNSEPEWKNLVLCMNDHYEERNPLIGREEELRRTVRTLCRKEKNNPLHIGEPGVGKTALVWGLVALIEKGEVPKKLRGSKVYQIELGNILAGTQFRGDFEKRIKMIMDGILSEGSNNIAYIDEIHTLVGAGATGEGAMDASNMLKPYLESGKIRFIGSTTYDEFNRHFSRSKGLVRRFQQIDIAEPTVEEAKNIIMQLRPKFEEFHEIKYTDEAIEFAVEASARHINDRFLPDKAIDLIDEAGAAMQAKEEKASVGRKEIAEVLSSICKVDALAEVEKSDVERLENLEERIRDQIYGQDLAVKQVVEAVQMSRAGLLDENKPLASLLFVGPTGVGKTEIARVVSRELGMELIRFDMSEYTEKHAVAKLIGAPAGYVGYDDGGLLTDAIRKSPNAVVLLDEIEKAHPDIYNILLQVMDYGRLTDNKGRHADFRNVILVMTSNAGAQYASQSSVGFASSVTRGSAMLKHVKKIFKPEFLNRLSGTVVFNDMDRQMATLILKKKLRELQEKLTAKNVSMHLSDEAFELLLKEGFIPEYGAREMDRVISNRLKPLLMKELLFGALKEGGKVEISVSKDSDESSETGGSLEIKVVDKS